MIFLRLFLSFTSVSCFAAEPILDMKTAIERGLSFSPDVQKADSVVKQQDANYRLAESKLFPTIQAQGLTKNNRSSTTYDPVTGASSINGLYQDTYTAQIVATQPIYSGGALQAGMSAARLNQDIAKQTLFAAKQDYLQTMLTAYLNAAGNDQKLDMAKLNRQILKGYMEVTQKYTSIGRNRTIDRLQAEANYQLSEATVLSAEVAEETAVQDLLKAIGDTKLAHSKLESHFEVQPVNPTSLEEAFETAVRNNPTLRAAHMQIDLTRSTNDVTEAADWPTVGLSGTFGYNSPTQQNEWDESSKFYTFGLTLTVPLFSGLSSIAQRRADREAVYQVERTAIDSDLAIKENLAVAMATVRRNFDQLKLARKAAESARIAMDDCLKEYRQGLVTSTDVIAIQGTRYNAEVQFLTAQFSYLIQVLNLRHDLGVDLEKVYAVK